MRDCFMSAELTDLVRRDRFMAEQRPCGRGEDGDPASAGVAGGQEPTGGDPSADDEPATSPSPGHSGERERLLRVWADRATMVNYPILPRLHP